MSGYDDKRLKCADCGGEFVWSAEEQEFFAGKGYEPPKRCKDCRQAKKAQRGDRGERKGGNR